MIQLIRFLKGYVSIKVWGFSPERFMNLCSNHNIFLWDIINHGEYYTMNISLKGFYRLRPISRKTGTRVVITKRCGLPFLSVRIKKRKIFMAGLIGSLLFWIWMSGFIWAVEIEGNYYVSTDVFYDFLKDNGIEAGIKKSSVPIEEVEKAIRKEFNIVTWTSVRIEGTKLFIQVKENDLSIQMKDESKKENVADVGMDLAAEKDGVVVSIVTRTGVPLVKEGTEVKKGDVLVEGGIPIMNDDGTVKRYDFCTADADIWLQCIYSYREKIEELYEKKVYTGNERKKYFVMVGAKKLQMPSFRKSYGYYDIVEEKKQLCLFENYYLPLYIGSELTREYYVEESFYTKEEIKSIFELKINKFIETLEEKGVQIIEKNVTINKTSGIWCMEVDFLALEKTGTLKKTHLEQIDETVPDEPDE